MMIIDGKGVKVLIFYTILSSEFQNAQNYIINYSINKEYDMK